MTKVKKKRFLTGAFAVVASFAMVTGAFADEVADTNNQDVDFSVDSGGLTLTVDEISGDFGTFDLAEISTVLNTGYDGPAVVSDARGMAEGWRLSVEATQFTEVLPEGATTNALTIPTGSLALDVEGIEGHGDEANQPTLNLTTNTIIDNGAVDVASAAVGTGMGAFDVIFPENALSLSLDASTTKVDNVNYPDSATPYESTIKWNLISAP